MEEKYARGPNYVFAKEYVIKTYGENIWKNVIDRLPEPYSEEWKGLLFASKDYSFTAFKNFTQTLTRVLGSYTQKETARMYEYIADRSLNSFYKMFFKFSSPSFVIRNYPKLWMRFFNAGEVIVSIAESKHAVVTFTLPEIFLDWLDDACYGFSKKAIELAGGRELKSRLIEKKSGGTAEWTISYDLTWVE